MKWHKEGLIFDAIKTANATWRKNSALTPQAYRLNKDVIRVFAGFRDDSGISRIGFVDVDSYDPKRIISISDEPVLDLGRNGCFDDNGLIMGDVVEAEGNVYLFYVGFQLVAKAKFLAFSGVAISTDGCKSFSRLSESPILDRADGQSTIGAIHTVQYENGTWRLWFAKGDGWEVINGIPYPRYHICYTETKDLLNIPRTSKTCVQAIFPEYRIGRPKVYKLMDGSYIMYATKGTIQGDYTPSFFRSVDGIDWVRDDSQLGISLSSSGWDSETLCYPTLIKNDKETYMFYNGNKMGLNGFGFARSSDVLVV